MTLVKKLWIGIGILIALSPLGLLLPEYFKAGGAWGEWGPADIQKMIGYLPEGLNRFFRLWKAPIPHYALNGTGTKGLAQAGSMYIISALAGVVLIAGIVFLIGKSWAKDDEDKT